MEQIDIVRQSDGSVIFVPASITVEVGEGIFWCNLDRIEAIRKYNRDF